MDSIHKYREVANACDKKKNMMVWAFEMLWDWWNRTDGKDTISIRTLRGEIPGWGGKSLIDLFLFKRTLRDALHQRCDAFDWPPAIKQRIKTPFGT